MAHCQWALHSQKVSSMKTHFVDDCSIEGGSIVLIALATGHTLVEDQSAFICGHVLCVKALGSHKMLG